LQKFSLQSLWPAATVLIFFLAAVLFRPLLPIDETRYMTVAWEMHLHQGWLEPLTMNFAPYSHKPPLLFWLINLFWSVFGISRWAGAIPLTLSSLAAVYAVVALGKRLLPADVFNAQRLALLTVASIPFMIYSTLVMFDMTVTLFVLLTLITLIDYSRARKFRYIVLMALWLGLGVLTKGPVAYLYTIFPMLLVPYWLPDFQRRGRWYLSMLAAILLSVIPVLTWLVPVLRQSDNQFAFWLVWEQTAGRVTGNFNDAHIRPFWFYLPLLPFMLLPWILFPTFWKNVSILKERNETTRFLACWLVPTFLCFCAISGKQPHYLVPLLPGVLLAVSLPLKNLSTRTMAATLAGLTVLLVAGQAVASRTSLRAYDLTPIASYMQQHPNKDWGFVRNYHGEVGYLAKLETPVDDLTLADVDPWFKQHPAGEVIIRYKDDSEVAAYDKVFSTDYRGKKLGIFRRR